MQLSDLPHNPDITYFGKTNFRNSEKVFGIKRPDRRQHMYVLGKSGAGKSAMMQNMIIQNIHAGEGVCVVDPHGELVESILATIPPERQKDVVYFNPADTDYHVGFNVLEIPDERYKHLVASGLMGIFTKIWANAWSARMEYILNNAILALLDTPGTTMLGIQRILVDKEYRQKILDNVKDPVVRAFWVHEYEAWQDRFRNEAIAPILNKVGQFLSTAIIRNVVGQSKSTINIFDIMNDGKIFLVNVSKGRIGEDNSALLGGMIVTKIQLAAMERVRISEEERRDFYLYVDEFQNFVTDSFAGILSEARKYRLALTLAHQYIGQLETDESRQVREAVFGNVGTMVVFRVGAADAEFLEKEFEPEFTSEDFVMLPNYRIYTKLMIDGVTSRPFSAQTLPPLDVHTDSDTEEKIIASSRSLYTRPREEVEREINEWSGAVSGDDEAHSQEGTKENEKEEFDAVCSICNTKTTVPFKPIEGLPVYCKTCHAKVRNGEIEPVKPNPLAQKKQGQAGKARAELAELGIEFQSSGGQKEQPQSQPQKKNTKRTQQKKRHNTKKRPKPTKTQKKESSGLKNLLSGVLAGDASEDTQTDDSTNSHTPKKKQSHNTDANTKTTGISLDTLSRKADTKKPSEENVNALKDVLEHVTGKGDTSEDESTHDHTAARASSDTDTKKADTQTDEHASSATATHTKENKQTQNKEVPEDILKQILK